MRPIISLVDKKPLSYSVCFAILIANTLSVITQSPVQAVEPSIRIALFVDKGAEASEFTKELNRNDDESISFKSIDGADIRSGALQHFDALLVPGGSASEESGSMGPQAREEVRRFVSNGGVYMGVCAGAYLASKAAKTDIGMIPLKTLDHEHWYRVDDSTRVDVELTPLGKEAFGINKSNIRIKYENGPIFGTPDEKPEYPLTTLAYFRSEVVGDGGERGVMLGAPAIVTAPYGKGIVMAISPHFEETPGFKQVQLHAIRWMYQHRGTSLASNEPQPINSLEQAKQARQSTQLQHASNSKPSTQIQRSNQLKQQQQLQTTIHPQKNGQTQNKISLATSSSAWNSHNSTLVPTESKTAEQSYSKGSNDEVNNTKRTDSSLGERALKLAESVFANASDVSYTHRQKIAAKQIISEPDGTLEAHTDCSGFISYVVHSVAPRHYYYIREQQPDASYPKAKIWARFFNTLDSNQPYEGWLGISNWHDLKPGDFIAWQEGHLTSGGNTGHVMMVVSQPSAVKQLNGNRFFEITVLDSSSVYHFPPERLPPKSAQKNRNGLGEGTVRIILDPDNKPIGYWAGTYWGEGQKQVKGPTLSKLVRFARMVPLEDTDY